MLPCHTPLPTFKVLLCDGNDNQPRTEQEKGNYKLIMVPTVINNNMLTGLKKVVTLQDEGTRHAPLAAASIGSLTGNLTILDFSQNDRTLYLDM